VAYAWKTHFSCRICGCKWHLSYDNAGNATVACLKCGIGGKFRDVQESYRNRLITEHKTAADRKAKEAERDEEVKEGGRVIDLKK
jgi:hypothetical protein